MYKFYVAGFVPEDEGGFSVYFPDLPGCFTFGNTLEEATFMANDVLKVMLEAMAKDNDEIPEPSSIDNVREMLKKERQEDDLPYPDGVIYQLIQAPSVELVPVRINVSLPKSVLAEVDKKAALYGFTRSGFLAHAAQVYHPETC